MKTDLEPVFVPQANYVAALKLALELALELRAKCDDEEHRQQVEAIDAALLEVGEGRPALQVIADRAPLVEHRRNPAFWKSHWGGRATCGYVLFPHRTWEQKDVRVSRREFDAVLLGEIVKTRGVLAFATMKTSDSRDGYRVRLEFREPVEA